VHFDPARVVFWRGGICIPNCFYASFIINLFMTPRRSSSRVSSISCAFPALVYEPYSVRPHVRAVQIRLTRIEHHAVDRGLVAVLEVLDIFGEVPGRIDGEDVAEARVLVEGVAVDRVGGEFGGEEEDCAGFGGEGGGLGCVG
jgi:hypothetical protein